MRVPVTNAFVAADVNERVQAGLKKTLQKVTTSSHDKSGTGGGQTPPSGDAVPSFRAIAAMPSTTALSLRVFLQTPHGRMPDFALSRNETDDVIAYILSLRGN